MSREGWGFLGVEVPWTLHGERQRGHLPAPGAHRQSLPRLGGPWRIEAELRSPPVTSNMMDLEVNNLDVKGIRHRSIITVHQSSLKMTITSA